MEQCQLVMSIVMDNESAFSELTEIQTKNCLLFSKMSQFNKAIMKHKDQYTRKQVMRNFFREFDRNIVSLVFATDNNDTNQIEECENKKNDMLDHAFEMDEESRDCFFRLFIANYKEYIYYKVCDEQFTRTEFEILLQYNQIVLDDNYIFDKVQNHIHDPFHYLFNDGHDCYQFFEMLERKGYSILDSWEY